MEADVVGSTNTGWFPPESTIASASPVRSRKRPGYHANDNDNSTHTPKRNRGESFTKEDNPKQSLANLDKQTIPPTRSYFNAYQQHKTKNPRRKPNDVQTSSEPSRRSFPPFRISLLDPSRYPTTEITIIREVNNHCKLTLTYGRFTKTRDDETCYLLYASTTAQFEHLMCQGNWPDRICKTEYQLALPTKIPSSYSIVVLNVPYQWNEQAFGEELKLRYPSTVRVVRLYRKGGHPLSKIRVDFSSFSELSTILKSKRLLLDEDKTAFAVEPYVAPTRVLRCYNCQAYDDHIAAHCPSKNDPVCFRCAQHHPFNPKCDLPIQCVHCGGEHMAGNPSCPVKAERRYEKEQKKNLLSGTCGPPTERPKHAWSANTVELLFNEERPTDATAIDTSTANATNNSHLNEFTNALRSINETLIQIKNQQDIMNLRSESIDRLVHEYTEDMCQIKYCLYEIICPLICELSNDSQKKARGTTRGTLTPLCTRLNQFISEVSHSRITTKSPNDPARPRKRVSSTDEPLTRLTSNES